MTAVRCIANRREYRSLLGVSETGHVYKLYRAGDDISAAGQAYEVRSGSWPCKNAASGADAIFGDVQAEDPAAHALMAAINDLVPMMFITRVRL